MSELTAKQKLNYYIKDPKFQSWYCYMEDKWLQYADWEEKLVGVFGSVENAIKRFEMYLEEERDC
ncbi:MAG TPA: hypothetical protein ACFYDZ_02535 [Candidatus Brocadiaceae bacterium]